MVGFEKKETLLRISLLFPALISVIIAVGIPMLVMIWISIGGLTGEVSANIYIKIFDIPVYTRAIAVTFKISLLTVLICLLVGTPYSLIMAAASSKVSQILLLMVLLPFWTALLVRTYTFLVLLQRNGLINSLLIDAKLVDAPLPLINNLFGTMVGMCHIMLPIFILPVYTAFKQIDPNIVKAAASCGASRIRTIFQVVLPLASSGIFAGTVLVFVLSLGFYVTPAILGGGRVAMISNRIERSIFRLSDWETAAALGVLLLLIVAAVFLVAAIVRKSWYRLKEVQYV
jgi:putative spermidine/putrescine transport system permease protein/spermidine/putrescine transport system permease protein